MAILEIKGFSHSAVRVSNLDKTLEFYQSIIGLEVVKHIALDGGFGRLAVCEIPGGVGVEFIELMGPEGTPAVIDGSVDTAMMAFAVSDIQVAYQALKDAGYEVNEPFGAAGVQLLMVADPDGRQVEIAQFGNALSAVELQRNS